MADKNEAKIKKILKKIQHSCTAYDNFKCVNKENIPYFLHICIRYNVILNFIKSLMTCNAKLKCAKKAIDEVQDSVNQVCDVIRQEIIVSDDNEKDEGLNILHELFKFQNQLIYFYCYINNLAHYHCDVKDIKQLLDENVPKKYIEYIMNTNINYRIIMSTLSLSLFDVFSILTQCNVDMDEAADDQRRKTVFHFAVEKNSLDIVQYVLYDFEGNIKATCAKGNTVLHYAVKLNTSTVIEYLLEEGCDVNAVNANNESVLHFAVKRNTLDVIKCLVRGGANLNAIDNKGNTVLHTACKRNTLAVIKYLVDEGKNINAKYNNNETILDIADKCNDEDIKSFLKTIRVNTTEKEKTWSSALKSMNSISKGVIPKAKIDVEFYGERLIRAASIEDLASITSILHTYSPAINYTNLNGVTAITVALKNQKLKSVSKLLQHGAGINIQNFISIFNEYEEDFVQSYTGDPIINFLKRLYFDTESLSSFKNEEIAEWFLPIFQQDLSNLCYLLSETVSNPSQIFLNKIFLENVVRNQCLRILTFLLYEIKDIVNMNILENQRTLLHKAVIENKTDVIQSLLEYGPNLDSFDSYKCTVMHYAVQYAQSDVIKLILKQNPDLFLEDNENRSVFHVAAEKCTNIGILDLIFQHHCPNSNPGVLCNLNLNSSTSKIYTIEQHSHSMCRNNVNLVNGFGESPLHFAAKYNSPEVNKYLMDLGADVLHKCKRGNNFFNQGKYAEAIVKYEAACSTSNISEHHQLYKCNIDRAQVEVDALNLSAITKLVSSIEELDEVVIRIGKIELEEAQILGRGCGGTIVYQGRFERKPVAVKRLLRENCTVADREIDLLRESDEHPNVIRYFCNEMDEIFIYVAIELCAATLEDYVLGKFGQGIIKDVDILQQATSGLAHLHFLKIVHRDIKPHNILLSVNNYGHIIAKLSDFGICKKLKYEQDYFTQSSGIKGTLGWTAPEIIQPDVKPTCSVDIFSLGCLFYYVLSKGQHAFGDTLRRQASIYCEKFRFSLEYLNGNENALAYNLISTMISHDPNKRPNATTVLKHPFFWDETHVLAFFQEVSDLLISKEVEDFVIQSLEDSGTAAAVVRTDWMKHVHGELASDLRKRGNYRGQSVKDLLRAIRNKKHHHRELTEDIKKIFGRVPEEFVQYWTSRFPLLLIHSWLAMQCVKNENSLKEYYDPDFIFTKNYSMLSDGDRSIPDIVDEPPATNGMCR